MMLWLLACTAECPAGSSLGEDGLCHLDDEEELPATSDPGWQLGGVQPCTAPLPAVSYIDASPIDPDWPGASDDSISIIAHQQDGQWRVVTSDSNHAVVSYGLDGTISRQTPGEEIRRLQLADLDGDGSLDLHTLGMAVQVGWSFASGEVVWQTVLSAEDLCLSPLSSTAADLDGDGDREILLPTGTGCLDTPAAEIALNDDGSFSLSEVPADVDFWGATFSPVIFDVDGDHDPDLYLCNDFGPETAGNGVLINDGTGALSPGDARGADVVTYCMSASVADLDSDGRLDIYIAALSEQFALVDSDAGYINQAAAWGLRTFSGEQMPWGSALGDTDNDGDVDILLATGDFLESSAEARFPLLHFSQTAPGEWVEDGAKQGLPQTANPRSVLLADLNDDGVLDILASDVSRPPHVLLSAGCTEANWLSVAAPDGSRVEVEAGGTVRVAQATAHPGFSATGPAVAHFGLGDLDSVDRIRAFVPWIGEVSFEGPVQTRQELVWVHY